MTDDSPRIFRNLEKTAGRDGFDTIVRAAVASYAALYRPSDAQARDFGRLALPLYDKVDAETRRILSASLSTCSKVPRVLVERLLAEPVAIAAPFLLSSPLLTPEDLALLARRRDAGMKKLLKARRDHDLAQASASESSVSAADDPEPSVEAPSFPAAVPAAGPQIALRSQRQTALLSAGTPADSEAPAAPSPASRSQSPNADETREILRRLATIGRGGGPASAAPAARAKTDLLSLAIDRDHAAFYAALAATLALDTQAVATLEADEGAQELAIALKAANIGTADAMTILMMMKPSIGREVAAFEAMEDGYAALDAAECAIRLGLSAPPARSRPKHAPLYADVASLGRPEARSTFGRRKIAPTEIARRQNEK